MQQNIVTKTTTKEVSSNKRHVRSISSQRIGYVLFDGQSNSVPCAVREFSENGAVLSMNGWMGVPEEFPLHIEPDRVRVVCRVLKKRGSKVQVSFKSWENGSTRGR